VVKLTQAGGAPSVVVNPDAVDYVSPVPDQGGTYVMLRGGKSLHVTEPLEQVVAMLQRAL
jgi:uncharacterized protein YlzI (FlbEa/FlbD family)